MSSVLKSQNHHKLFGLWQKLYRSLSQCKKGFITVEMALIAPIIIMMILSSADIVSYLTAHQKISRAAYTISNLITQMDEGLTESKISDMMLSIGEVSKPFNMLSDGKATVTAIIGIGTDGAAPDSYQVAWQRCYGTGTVTRVKNFGAAGSLVATADIPADMIATTAQILIVTEVIYNYTPVLGFLALDRQIEYLSYFRPRLGSIAVITDDAVSTSSC